MNTHKKVNWRFFWFKENIGGLFVGETEAENIIEAIKKIGQKNLKETYEKAKKGDFFVEEDYEPQLILREPITQIELKKRKNKPNSTTFYRYELGTQAIEFKQYEEEIKLIIKANIILSGKDLEAIK